MKNYFDTVKYDLSTFHSSDWMILCAILAMFFTQYGLAAVLVIILVHELKNKKLISDIKEQPGWKWIYGFIGLQLIVTLFYGNWIGLLNAFGMLIIMAFIAVYRQCIHPKLFYYCIDLMLLLSVLMGILGLVQFAILSHEGGYSFWEFHIQNSPKRRITALFDNANLYGTMLEFWIFLCVYRFIQNKKRICRIAYVCIGLFNLGLMLLTGCRTALIPFVLIVPLFFYFSKEKKWLILSLATLAVLIGFVFMKPTLIPRITDMSTLESRFKIWSCAIHGFLQYPLFGMGPQSYHLYYQMFDGHKAPHAHNIYIDSFASYGVVGTLILGIYFFKYLVKEILGIRKENRVLFGLVIGFLLIFLIHGLLDVTMNHPCTALLFLMVINSGCMAKKSLEI